jgi:tetratricopeptide (TPR) repeat protein
VNEHLLAQLLDQAATLGSQGKWLHASQALLRILQEHPERTDVSLRLAALYADNGNAAEAERVLLTALGRDEYNSDLLYALGAIFFHSGDLDRALYYFEQLVSYRLPQVHFMLGRVYERKGDPVAAERHARLALDLDPVFPGAPAFLAQLLLRHGDAERVLEFLEDAVRRESGDVELRFFRGLALSLTGRWDEALASFEALRQPMAGDVRLVCATARVNLELRRYAEAEELLHAALALEPEHAELLVLLGTSALLQSERERSRRYFDRALELDPDNIEALEGLKYFAPTKE